MVKISNYHKTLDKLQYVPVASTGLGLYFLYKKAVYNFETQSQPLDPERFYYVEDKSLLRCITLLVPVLGNIAVTFFDYLTGQFSDKEFWLSLVTDHDFNQKTDNYQGKLKRAPLSLRQNGEFMLKAIEKNHLAFEDAHISLKNDPTFFKSVVKIVSNKLAIYIQNRIKCCIIRPNDEIDLNIDNAIKSSLGFLEEMFEQCDRKIKSDWDFFVELAPLYGASILNYADESIANIFFVLQIYELADCKIITPTEILSKLNLPTLQSKINLQSYLRADGEIITPTKILSKLYLPTQQSRISLPSYLCTENIFKLCDEKIETLKNENKLKALSELPSVHKNFFFWNTIARNDINLFKSLCPSSLLDDLTFWENLAKNPHFLATTILSAPEKLKSNKLFWEKMAFKSKDILKLLPENLKLNEDLYLITVKTHFNTTESEQAMLEVIPDEVLNLELFCSELYSCRSYKLRATHNTSVQDSIEDNAKYSEILKNLIPSQELIIDSVPESVEDNTQFWIGLIKTSTSLQAEYIIKNLSNCLVLNAKKLWLTIVAINGCYIKYAPRDIQQDTEVVLAACNKNLNALNHISKDLSESPCLWEELLNYNGNYLIKAPDCVKNDYSLVYTACKNGNDVFRHASEAIQEKFKNVWSFNNYYNESINRIKSARK